MDSFKRKKSKSQSKEPALNNYTGNQSPPAGLFLIYFPHVFGLMHAAWHLPTPVPDILRAGAVLFGGAFFVSNAIHIWNDLIDAPLDALVSRTKHRRIPRCAVSPTAELVYTITQAIAAALFLPLLPHSQTWFYALPSILGWTYYPWAKRHTNYPQVLLGLCLARGVVMGELSLGIEMISFPQGWSWKKNDPRRVPHIEDDLKAGIKSIAVLWRQQTKILLWGSLVTLALLLSYCGYAIIGATGSLGRMILQVDQKDEQSCWWWFRS
ncbi:uncharacterized protein P174DRAFT_458718 [Aspergillus novofumigatus IBT 16806]|uniref:UbiA prenyltransferase n=1 Tax=Aspergillus novofumigatus (strain IBT 16806) TaxID=1392255 RepID=A0A2I1CBY2_ASPN1|nr:uncharacterized protein P174DRAFT_458718 [Aspergillus novofumigatus IBT 16806]PKX95145.1 hypothetical protein P174DRAFT_458718 [Aspergillus novofumigatus IBT 16806]